MGKITAVVQEGQIVLPERLPLPDGTVVRIVWEEEDAPTPFEPEPLTEEDVQADLEWARGNRFMA